MIRVFTAFSGYDSQCLALDRLRRDFPPFQYRLVGWSEIDRCAIQAHNALFPDAAQLNFGDIGKIDWAAVPDFDLFTYSFPCQDISAAGLQRGFDRHGGTRSGLLWECEKAIAAKRPKFLLMENVKALVTKKFKPLFLEWLTLLQSYGYTSHWQVLNAKDFGVPQNRERVFAVSILGDGRFTFPAGWPLRLTLDDVLEDEVDDKYRLSNERINGLLQSTIKELQNKNGYTFRVKKKAQSPPPSQASAGGVDTDSIKSG